jgi:hypothetical protein
VIGLAAVLLAGPAAVAGVFTLRPEDIEETMGGLAVWPELRYRVP